MFSPLRLAFLAAGFALGHWLAGVQHDLACRDAGGRIGESGVCLGAGAQ